MPCQPHWLSSRASNGVAPPKKKEMCSESSCCVLRIVIDHMSHLPALIETIMQLRAEVHIRVLDASKIGTHFHVFHAGLRVTDGDVMWGGIMPGA